MDLKSSEYSVEACVVEMPVNPTPDTAGQKSTLESQAESFTNFNQTRQNSDSFICRICQASTDELSLISPCLCKGSMKYVHLGCLELWLNRSGLTRCELCLHTFQTHETLRYGCCESLLVWYRNQEHRNLLMSDLVIYSILSFVCLMLTLVCLLVLRLQESGHEPFGEELAKAAVICFLSLVIIAYSANVIIIARDHVLPWYRWWKSARNVRLSRFEIVDHGMELV
ncbi:E3 ubiquitin-protein ligase MARCHF3-like [Anopheles ziemanni]|uniref:E3 ubiquitin-protein ligase MARCHF3-like n=1 Tax=Anopheles coustani TaxID=139045 RepID=UPI00265980CF|nr:E3 ubiquitin-protein ligase MARCHF3-like [Anopheles coustani]XP_058178273.1 E3 ubiquitin-protein ligase MARCHF3-like [Anopheles ziemanni]